MTDWRPDLTGLCPHGRTLTAVCLECAEDMYGEEMQMDDRVDKPDHNPYELVMDIPITKWEAFVSRCEKMEELLAEKDAEIRRLGLELNRALRAHETISSITKDIQDKIRRYGPAGEALSGLREDSPLRTYASEGAPAELAQDMGVSFVSGEASK